MYLLSIIIPVYNANKLIEETIKCIKNQTYKNFEIIIIDDKSTDNTLSFIEPYLEDKRIILYSQQKNSGPSMARNVGIELANGEYIVFLDSDDLWPFNYLQTINDFVSANSDLDIFVSKGYIFNHNEIIRPLNNSIKNFSKEIIFSNSIGSPSGICIKKKALEKCKFPEELRMFEDFYLYLLLVKNNFKFMEIDNFYFYRVEGQNTSSTKKDELNKVQIEVFKKLLKKLSLSSNELSLINSVLIPYTKGPKIVRIIKIVRLILSRKILIFKYFNYIRRIVKFYLKEKKSIQSEFLNMRNDTCK